MRQVAVFKLLLIWIEFLMSLFLMYIKSNHVIVSAVDNLSLVTSVKNTILFVLTVISRSWVCRCRSLMVIIWRSKGKWEWNNKRKLAYFKVCFIFQLKWGGRGCYVRCNFVLYLIKGKRWTEKSCCVRYNFV